MANDMSDDFPPFYVRKQPQFGGGFLWALIDARTQAVYAEETQTVHYHHLLILKDRLNGQWAKDQTEKGD